MSKKKETLIHNSEQLKELKKEIKNGGAVCKVVKKPKIIVYAGIEMPTSGTLVNRKLTKQDEKQFDIQWLEETGKLRKGKKNYFKNNNSVVEVSYS